MRTKSGVITSAKMDKTVTVTVHRYVMHDKYEKRFRVSKKFLADTNGHDVGVGDEVVITECRPISKRKCFKVTEITKQVPRVSEIKDEDVEQKTKRDHRDQLAVKKAKDSPAKS